MSELELFLKLESRKGPDLLLKSRSGRIRTFDRNLARPEAKFVYKEIKSFLTLKSTVNFSFNVYYLNSKFASN